MRGFGQVSFLYFYIIPCCAYRVKILCCADNMPSISCFPISKLLFVSFFAMSFSVFMQSQEKGEECWHKYNGELTGWSTNFLFPPLPLQSRIPDCSGGFLVIQTITPAGIPSKAFTLMTLTITVIARRRMGCSSAKIFSCEQQLYHHLHRSKRILQPTYRRSFPA